MAKLWSGRLKSGLDAAAEDFNASIRVDARMAREDIAGSAAHAAMLGACGILTQEDAALIQKTLAEIAAEIAAGTLAVDAAAEDVHTFVEQELTARIGEAGKRLHTARSRNDQVATDFRLHLRGRIAETARLTRALIAVLCARAEEHAGTILPGYTHLQRAQPVSFGHHLMAYAAMLRRDCGRLADCAARMDAECPLGSGALAGTTFPINRAHTAALLGFAAPCANSMDGVSDRDFALELLAALSILMTHLSRFSEEIILWSSWEFKFVELADTFSTGSSIMPQKKNPDIAELVRGKTGRVYGNLLGLLTTLKGLPLAYNKDMQEDKEAVFSALDTADACLTVFAPMVSTMRVLPERMRAAAAGGFINATDCADYLVSRGAAFRDAYKTTGELVAFCIARGVTLETLPLEDYQKFDARFAPDVFAAVDLANCLALRTSAGGPARESVLAQAAAMKKWLEA